MATCWQPTLNLEQQAANHMKALDQRIKSVKKYYQPISDILAYTNSHKDISPDITSGKPVPNFQDLLINQESEAATNTLQR